MTEPTVGDLARFLDANPGPHRLGRFTVEHKGTFKVGETWATAFAEGTGQPTNHEEPR